MTNTLSIALEVHGQGDRTLVMAHGWPDTAALWQLQVAHFAPHLRCVSFTWPGFDVLQPRQAPTLQDRVDFLTAVLDRVSPDAPVVLMLHDWGAVFGLEVAMQRPERVSHLVVVDVADGFSAAMRRERSIMQTLMTAAYQWPLVAAWHLPRRAGDALTRTVARAVGCRAPANTVGACMNHPYAMLWLKSAGGLDALSPVQPRCPVFFAWGTKNPLRFHSREWLQALQGRADSRVVAYPCGHWVMRSAAAAFNADVQRWLQETGALSLSSPPT